MGAGGAGRRGVVQGWEEQGIAPWLAKPALLQRWLWSPAFTASMHSTHNPQGPRLAAPPGARSAPTHPSPLWPPCRASPRRGWAQLLRPPWEAGRSRRGLLRRGRPGRRWPSQGRRRRVVGKGGRVGSGAWTGHKGGPLLPSATAATATVELQVLWSQQRLGCRSSLKGAGLKGAGPVLSACTAAAAGADLPQLISSAVAATASGRHLAMLGHEAIVPESVMPTCRTWARWQRRWLREPVRRAGSRVSAPATRCTLRGRASPPLPPQSRRLRLATTGPRHHHRPPKRLLARRPRARSRRPPPPSRWCPPTAPPRARCAAVPAMACCGCCGVLTARSIGTCEHPPRSVLCQSLRGWSAWAAAVPSLFVAQHAVFHSPAPAGLLQPRALHHALWPNQVVLACTSKHTT